MRLKYLIPLAIFLFLCGFLFKGLYMDPREVPSALIDKPAPEFSLPTMQGETIPSIAHAVVLEHVGKEE